MQSRLLFISRFHLISATSLTFLSFAATPLIEKAEHVQSPATSSTPLIEKAEPVQSPLIEKAEPVQSSLLKVEDEFNKAPTKPADLPYSIIYHSYGLKLLQYNSHKKAFDQWQKLKGSNTSRMYYGRDEVQCKFKDDKWMKQILQEVKKHDLPPPPFLVIHHARSYHYRGFYDYYMALRYYKGLDPKYSKLVATKNTIKDSYCQGSIYYFNFYILWWRSTDWKRDLVEKWILFYEQYK
eukprot:75708_1